MWNFWKTQGRWIYPCWWCTGKSERKPWSRLPQLGSWDQHETLREAQSMESFQYLLALSWISHLRARRADIRQKTRAKSYQKDLTLREWSTPTSPLPKGFLSANITSLSCIVNFSLLKRIFSSAYKHALISLILTLLWSSSISVISFIAKFLQSYL